MTMLESDTPMCMMDKQELIFPGEGVFFYACICHIYCASMKLVMVIGSFVGECSHWPIKKYRIDLANHSIILHRKEGKVAQFEIFELVRGRCLSAVGVFLIISSIQPDFTKINKITTSHSFLNVAS